MISSQENGATFGSTASTPLRRQTAATDAAGKKADRRLSLGTLRVLSRGERTPMNSIVNWFEIPTANLDRAVKFYERMLGIRLKLETFHGIPQAILLGDANEGSGSLIADPRRKPTADGTLVY